MSVTGGWPTFAVLGHQAHTARALYVSHFGNRLHDPSTFSLISSPLHRYYRATQVIYKITLFFDNLTRAQLLAMVVTNRSAAESDQQHEGENLRPALCCCPERRRKQPTDTLTPMF